MPWLPKNLDGMTVLRRKEINATEPYGTGKFLKKAANLFGGVQVISQLRNNQNLRFRGKKYSVEQYFRTFPGVTQTIRLRGGEPVTVTVGSARLPVCAHQGQKRFVIALKG